MNLSPKQEAFVNAYLETNNASEAYRRVYATKGKPETIYPNASRLLAKSNIAARVKELLDLAASHSVITRERWLEEIAAVAFGVLPDVAPWDEQGPHIIPSAKLTRPQQALVSLIKVKRRRELTGDRKEDAQAWEVEELEVRPNDKVRALDLYGKARGWPIERIELDATVKIEGDDAPDDDESRELARQWVVNRAAAAGRARATPQQ